MLRAWGGKPENIKAGQDELIKRAKVRFWLVVWIFIFSAEISWNQFPLILDYNVWFINILLLLVYCFSFLTFLCLCLFFIFICTNPFFYLKKKANGLAARAQYVAGSIPSFAAGASLFVKQHAY